MCLVNICWTVLDTFQAMTSNEDVVFVRNPQWIFPVRIASNWPLSPISSSLHFLPSSLSHTQNSKICLKLAMHYSLTICIVLPLNIENACVNLSFKAASCWIHIRPLMVTVAGTESAQAHLKWSPSTGSCDFPRLLLISSYFPFLPRVQTQDETKRAFYKDWWGGCRTEHLGLVRKKEQECGRGTKKEKQVPCLLDSNVYFSFSHFHVSEIAMCLKSLYKFHTVCLPHLILPPLKLLSNWWYILKPFW